MKLKGNQMNQYDENLKQRIAAWEDLSGLRFEHLEQALRKQVHEECDIHFLVEKEVKERVSKFLNTPMLLNYVSLLSKRNEKELHRLVKEWEELTGEKSEELWEEFRQEVLEEYNHEELIEDAVRQRVARYINSPKTVYPLRYLKALKELKGR